MHSHHDPSGYEDYTRLYLGLGCWRRWSYRSSSPMGSSLRRLWHPNERHQQPGIFQIVVAYLVSIGVAVLMLWLF